MEVGNLLYSEIMQLLPLSFAKSLLNNLFSVHQSKSKELKDTKAAKEKKQMKGMDEIIETQKTGQMNYSLKSQEDKVVPETVNVQPAYFKPFEEEIISNEKQNFDIVMDIPLQVTAELGRTQKLIKEMLEFSYGTIIELDKLAGDPVDIYVNGKKVAKGEVVVIDDSFGVRITDIVHPSKRL
jgi:flagellar motor switch protein FliN/FliY